MLELFLVQTEDSSLGLVQPGGRGGVDTVQAEVPGDGGAAVETNPVEGAVH